MVDLRFLLFPGFAAFVLISNLELRQLGTLHHVSACASLSSFSSASAQEPASPPSTAAPQQSRPAPETSSQPAKHKHTPFDDFLIRGTVFNDKALAFPGVDIRIRRAGEKKFHWQDVTNSRGDFAIRVPHNASYEIVTRAKGFLGQTKTVDAKPGLTEQNLSIQMEPAQGKK